MSDVFVKVCGLRTDRDVRAAVDAGADAVGFVLAPSPREVSPAEAARLVAGVADAALTVAVVTSPDLVQVIEWATEAGVRAVQLHGTHPASAFAALREAGLGAIRATAHAHAPEARAGDLGEDLLLLDSAVAGSGQAWDWGALTEDEPEGGRGRWLLAGGLRPDTVARAIEVARPWGVDVSSGVESSRGVKDAGLIAAFVHAAKGSGSA